MPMTNILPKISLQSLEKKKIAINLTYFFPKKFTLFFFFKQINYSMNCVVSFYNSYFMKVKILIQNIFYLKNISVVSSYRNCRKFFLCPLEA